MASNPSNSSNSVTWIWISGIAFLICFCASAVLIIYGKQLEDLGIAGNFYYIILIPLGFSSAAFLAGGMKSYASFKSNETLPYGKLNLSGPVVIFFLVVGGGFIFPNLNKDEQFDLKMRLQSEDKMLDSLNTGSVTIHIGDHKEKENIHNGEVVFSGIPAKYLNKKMRVFLSAGDFQLKNRKEVFLAKNDEYIDLNCVKTTKIHSTLIRGSIITQAGKPVKNARLDFNNGLTAGTTDNYGNFSASVPVPAGEKMGLKIFVGDDMKFNEQITISSNTPLELMIE